jgi:hypothetical protein
MLRARWFAWETVNVLILELKFLKLIVSDMYRVCDIGSGTGATGIAAACLGADAVLTDQVCVFPLLQENMNNAISACSIAENRIRIAEYNWGESVDGLEAPFDIVIVSDCVLPKLYPIEPLVQAVHAVMHYDTVAYFSYEHRPFPDFDPRQVRAAMFFCFYALHYSCILRSFGN